MELFSRCYFGDNARLDDSDRAPGAYPRAFTGVAEKMLIILKRQKKTD